MGARGGMPSAEAEGRLYPLVDRLQQRVAVEAIAAGATLQLVPTWTLQFLVHVLASRTASSSTGELRFTEFARLQADAGSRLFADDNCWVGADAAAIDVARFSDAMADATLRVLVGRALDYGRTLCWEHRGGVLTKARDLATSKTQGIFYTPAFVAHYLAQQGLRGFRGNEIPLVCDPAIGGGVFLVAAAEVLLRKFDGLDVAGHLYGADTDPLAAEVAAMLVDSRLGVWDAGQPPPSLGTTIVVGDSFGGPVRRDSGEGLPGAIHWPATFPEVFEQRGGFDLVLLNPPFGRYKVDSDWLVAKEMRLDPASLKMIRTAGKQRASALRDSGWYPLSTVGVLDKSRLGLERGMQLTAMGGRLGAIVPTTLTADIQSTNLRRALLEDWNLEEANEFPEAARLFYDVSQSTSAIVAKRSGKTQSVAVRSDVRNDADLRSPFQGRWPVALIRALSPRCPIPVRASAVADILGVLHSHPQLEHLGGVVNARGEVDLTIFSSAITDDVHQMPLVRGDQVDCYRTDLVTDKKRFVDEAQFVARLQGSPKLQHVRMMRLVGRQCSYLYRHKRLSFAAVEPHQAVANSCNYIAGMDEDRLLVLLAFLNSEVLNWRFSITNSNNHVSNAELGELPIPMLRSASGDFRRIRDCARALCESFDPALDAELDARVARAYGLSSAQAATIHAVREKSADVRDALATS